MLSPSPAVILNPSLSVILNEVKDLPCPLRAGSVKDRLCLLRVDSAKHLSFRSPHRRIETRPTSPTTTASSTASETAFASASKAATQSRATTAPEPASTTRPNRASTTAPAIPAGSAPDSDLATRAETGPTSDLGSHSPLQVRSANSSAVLHNPQSLTPSRPQFPAPTPPPVCAALHNSRPPAKEKAASRRLCVLVWCQLPAVFNLARANSTGSASCPFLHAPQWSGSECALDQLRYDNVSCPSQIPVPCAEGVFAPVEQIAAHGVHEGQYVWECVRVPNAKRFFAP